MTDSTAPVLKFRLETNPIARFHEKPGRSAAIAAKCAECMGCSASQQGTGFEDHLEPNFRQLIRDCSAPWCPLYDYRPFQNYRSKSETPNGDKS